MIEVIRRAHPLNRLRTAPGTKTLMGALDLESWARLRYVDHPVRVRLTSHLTYMIAPPDPEIRRLLRAARPRAFWDVGANCGYYTWLVGNGLMFEPDPNNARLIRATLQRHGNVQQRLVQAAVSDVAGEATLELERTGFRTRLAADRDGGLRVMTVRLDDLGERPDFVKIDVEGHEMHVLRGAERLLRRREATLLFEAFDPAEPTDFLECCGYRVQRLDGDNYLAVPA